jgi:hypothetical protein
VAGIDFEISGVKFATAWDRMSFSFEPGVYADATAVVNRGTLHVDYKHTAWRAECTARYTDQDYENTPADLIVDSPSRNLWLDGRDNFDVSDIAAFDTDSYADVGVTAMWSRPESDRPTPAWLPTSARLNAEITSDGFFRSRLYTQARLSAEKVIRKRYVVLVDGRAASYNREAWAPAETFLSGYLEVGYRNGPLEMNLGYGFDPLVFDPVVNEYRDIGRSKHLRRALDAGVERGNSEILGRQLILLERALGDAHVLKLECVIRF